MTKTFEVIDITTGRPPSSELLERIAKEYGLMEMDIDQFAVTEDGHLLLVDDCGRCSYVDTEGFNLKYGFFEMN